eukprot:652376-Rhodomonas_salina.13
MSQCGRVLAAMTMLGFVPWAEIPTVHDIDRHFTQPPHLEIAFRPGTIIPTYYCEHRYARRSTDVNSPRDSSLSSTPPVSWQHYRLCQSRTSHSTGGPRSIPAIAQRTVGAMPVPDTA